MVRYVFGCFTVCGCILGASSQPAGAYSVVFPREGKLRPCYSRVSYSRVSLCPVDHGHRQRDSSDRVCFLVWSRGASELYIILPQNTVL